MTEKSYVRVKFVNGLAEYKKAVDKDILMMENADLYSISMELENSSIVFLFDKGNSLDLMETASKEFMRRMCSLES